MRQRNAVLIVGLALVGLMLVPAAIPGVLAPRDPHAYQFSWVNPDTGKRLMPPFPPSQDFPLGSDVAGRDLLTRVVWGARFTLGVAVIVAGARFALALLFGTLAGYCGGVAGWIVRRMAGVFAGLPLVLLTWLMLQSYQRVAPESGNKPLVFILALVVLGWPRLAEQVRLLVSAMRGRPHIESAHAVGASAARIAIRHVLLLLSGQLLALLAAEVAFALIAMGQLGVLGVFPGGPFVITDHDMNKTYVDHLPEWGQMLGISRQFLGRQPWVPIVPGTAFALGVFSINVLAEGLRRRLAP